MAAELNTVERVKQSVVISFNRPVARFLLKVEKSINVGFSSLLGLRDFGQQMHPIVEYSLTLLQRYGLAVRRSFVPAETLLSQTERATGQMIHRDPLPQYQFHRQADSKTHPM